MKTFTIKSKVRPDIEVLLDDDDFVRVTQHKWYADVHKDTFYIKRNITKDGKKTKQMLHRFIMEVDDPELVIDHHDKNPLNNQKENLRRATRTQNQYNRGKQRNSTSGHKGVSYNKNAKKFTAQINRNGVKDHIGCFSTAEEASEAYEIEAKKLQGEFYPGKSK